MSSNDQYPTATDRDNVRKIKPKTCEHCGYRARFRRWDGEIRKYVCRWCGKPTGRQEKST